MFDSDYSDCCRCAVLKIMLEKEEIEQRYTNLEDQTEIPICTTGNTHQIMK